MSETRVSEDLRGIAISWLQAVADGEDDGRACASVCLQIISDLAAELIQARAALTKPATGQGE